jgi:hypothetical protein
MEELCSASNPRPGDPPVAIKAPPFSPDDQEYYPLHEEDNVPETPDHEVMTRFSSDGSSSHH